MSTKKRLQFDFTQSEVDALDNDVESLNAASRAQVVRSSLKQMRRLRKFTNDDGALIIRNENDEKIIIYID